MLTMDKKKVLQYTAHIELSRFLALFLGNVEKVQTLA